MKGIMSGDKGRERSLTDYCHQQDRLDSVKLMEFITSQNQSRITKSKTNLNKHLPPTPPSFQSLPLHPQQCRETGMEVVVCS